jgi:hypothetical protein
MLTFFTTAKAFRGHSNLIQRNALKSWKRLHPDTEVILFGDDEGATETAQELGLWHEPSVLRNEYGTKRLDYMFAQAGRIARHNTLCYINCDIVLMDDFRRAVERVKHAREQFLAVGRRWDTDISEPCDFSGTSWEGKLRSLVMQRGVQRTPEWIDYFVFTRGLYKSGVPPFVIGRVHWDHWLVWKIQATESIPVVDLSAAVMAVHQNHDYSYHPQGKAGIWHGHEAGQNERLAGGWRHMRTIADATEILCEDGLRPNRGRHWSTVGRYASQIVRVARFDVWNRGLFFALGLTRPLRRWLGLRAELFAKWRGNV